jgi:hypothetical protein
MGVKPIFYQLSTVYGSIFFSYRTIERTDGSAMGVKPIFISFPWWMTCLHLLPFLLDIRRTDESAMGVKPIFYWLSMISEMIFIFFSE